MGRGKAPNLVIRGSIPPRCAIISWRYNMAVKASKETECKWRGRGIGIGIIRGRGIIKGIEDTEV